MLRLQPARRLIRRQRDDLLGVHVVDRQIGASLRQRIIQVTFKGWPLLLKAADAELRLLLIGNALLRLLGLHELLRRLVAAFEVAIVSAADHRVRMQFDFATLFDRLCRDGARAQRSLQLDKVHPDARMRTRAGFVPSLAEHGILGLACVRTFVAHGKVAVAARIDLDGNLQRLRIRQCAGDLMRAQHIKVRRVCLARADLDEAALLRRFIAGSEAHPQRVSTRRPVRGRSDARVATERVEHEPGARLALRQLRVIKIVLMVIGELAARELRIIHVLEAKLRGRRRVFDLGEAAVKQMRRLFHLRDVAQPLHDVRVLRLLRRIINRRAPFLEAPEFLRVTLRIDGHVFVRPLLGIFAELLDFRGERGLWLGILRLDPVNPDGELRADAVALLGLGKEAAGRGIGVV